jgi:ubiquinone/menaquinone biosynthesis C-methylase UbiE
MMRKTLSSFDEKWKFGGILKNPYISKLHRHALDGFKVRQLAKHVKGLCISGILDVCCGLGEYSTLGIPGYVGLDNDETSIAFARRAYKSCGFVHADAQELPFADSSFDAVLFAGSAHHFSDTELAAVMRESDRVSRKFIIIADIISTPGQGMLSRFLYSQDRGRNIRTPAQMEEMLRSTISRPIDHQAVYKTFPGFYTHILFICPKTGR